MNKARLFRISAKDLPAFRHWCADLMSIYRTEALKTMREEGCAIEGVFLLKQKRNYYVLTLGVYDKVPRPADMTNELNKRHFAFIKKVLKPLQKEPILQDDLPVEVLCLLSI